ncbi:MAG: hypothetical protein WAO08_28930, partial [Hyphomicrobiaceae bacterium]
PGVPVVLTLGRAQPLKRDRCAAPGMGRVEDHATAPAEALNEPGPAGKGRVAVARARALGDTIWRPATPCEPCNVCHDRSQLS